MQLPTSLKRKDTIAIVATARKISLEEIRNGIALLELWGFTVVVGASIGLESGQLAGTDQDRANDFQHQLDDPDVKAIWCARGGYGTVRMVDLIDFSRFLQQPKWVMGYSDVTVLHSHIHQLGVATLHAPMPIDITNVTNESVARLKGVLYGKITDYKIAGSMCNRLGSSKGVLVGGNLSMLYSLCGSPSALETKGKILFIEDLDEYLYHVDRMMQNLKRNGVFRDLNGLVVGGMVKLHDNAIAFGRTLQEIILDSVQEYNFPVVFDFPSGHIQNNQPLILGKEVVLEVGVDEVLMRYECHS